MNNCCSCGKYLKVDGETRICEACGGEHHPKCSGDNMEGFGEYPHETEYSICKKCIKKINSQQFDSHGKPINKLNNVQTKKKVPTHKEFQKAVDNSGLRGYKFGQTKDGE